MITIYGSDENWISLSVCLLPLGLWTFQSMIYVSMSLCVCVCITFVYHNEFNYASFLGHVANNARILWVPDACVCSGPTLEFRSLCFVIHSNDVVLLYAPPFHPFRTRPHAFCAKKIVS